MSVKINENYITFFNTQIEKINNLKNQKKLVL